MQDIVTGANHKKSHSTLIFGRLPSRWFSMGYGKTSLDVGACPKNK